MKCNVYAYDLVLINNNVRSGDFSVDRKNQLISPVTGVYVVFQLCGEKPKIRPYILGFKKILQFFLKQNLINVYHTHVLLLYRILSDSK